MSAPCLAPRTARCSWALLAAALVPALAAALAPGAEALVPPPATGETAPRAAAGAAPAPAPPWSFRKHVIPVLTAAGCNSGACHGAAAGKNGFKLSLRGYDPEGDFLMITRQARGRRVVPSDPGRSLLLLKPTAAVPHKGGERFATASLEHQVLSEWIAAGAPGPSPDDPIVEGIEVEPSKAVLAKGARLPLRVRALYSDGSAMDVTRWSKYGSTESSVAQVEAAGLIELAGSGEAAVTVWYSSKVSAATVTVPYENAVAERVFDEAPRRNFIDDLVLSKLHALRIPPSPRSTDAELLRRASLDTIGTLPAPEEARAFLADSSPDKRDRLISRLLERPELVDYWSYKWSDLFLLSSESLRPQALWAFYRWIRDRVAAGTPWDVLAREVVTAKGSTLENGAANFYVLHQDPLDMAETTSVAFLGMSINCARCHNHPMERWTNDQYYGMANLFARVRAKDAPGEGNRVIFTATGGDVVQPLRGKPQPPRPLDGEALPFDSPEDRRVPLARWLTSPENPYFTRAVVNRVWANFFGTGLVEKVDDMRASNPASNEELLGALCRFLVEARYDLKALLRLILESETYQRSSAPVPGNEQDRRTYARCYPRRLMAEVLLDALSQATGAPTELPGYPAGWRAIQLPDSNVASYFLDSFGRPDRLITCECERTSEPSMAQVLHIANGDTLEKKLKAKDNRISKLLEARSPLEAVIEEAFLATVSRFPTEAERVRLGRELEASVASPREALEDLFWSLLSSREFLFNH